MQKHHDKHHDCRLSVFRYMFVGTESINHSVKGLGTVNPSSMYTYNR